MGLFNLFKKERKPVPTEPENYNYNHDPYSRSADQTRFIRMSFFLSLFVLGGLFAVELLHKENQQPVIFTSEINHLMLQGVIISFVGLSGYVFGRAQGEASAAAKMLGNGYNGYNGTNGNGNGYSNGNGYPNGNGNGYNNGNDYQQHNNNPNQQTQNQHMPSNPELRQRMGGSVNQQSKKQQGANQK